MCICRINWPLSADDVSAAAAVGALFMAAVAAWWAKKLSTKANETAVDSLAVSVLTTLANETNTAVRRTTPAGDRSVDVVGMVSPIVNASQAVAAISSERAQVHATLFRALLDTAVITELADMDVYRAGGWSADSTMTLQFQYETAREFLKIQYRQPEWDE